MKKSKLLFLTLFFLASLSTITFVFFRKPTFCIPLDIDGFANGNVPYVHVEIEGERYPFILDLGFNGDASIKSEYLEKIKNKTFVQKSRSYGFLGKEYTKNTYEIPQLNIGSLKFHPVTLDEESMDFQKDSEIIPPKDPMLVKIAGALGCRIFQDGILCLDINFSKIAICDSIKTFKKEVHPLNTFSHVPLLTEHDCIEFEIMTPKGPMRCLLDSGFTSNCLNSAQPVGTSLDQLITDDKYAIKYEKIQVGSKDFGPITFRPIPIKFPFHIDAILGREFLADHVVVIDFINREIYFAKSVKNE